MSSSSLEKNTSTTACKTNTECNPSKDKTPNSDQNFKSPTHKNKKKHKKSIKNKGKTLEINRIPKTEIDSDQAQYCKTEECQDVLKTTWNKDSKNCTATNWTLTSSKKENTINKSESAQQSRVSLEQYEKHNKQSILMQWDVNQDEEMELVQSFEGIIGYQKSQQQSQLFPSLRRSQLDNAAVISQKGSAVNTEQQNIPRRKQQSSHVESEFSRSAQMNTLKKLGILFDAIEQNHPSKQSSQQRSMREQIYSGKQPNSTQQNYNSMNMEPQNTHNPVNNSNNNSTISSPVFNPKMILPIGHVMNQFNQVQSVKSKKVPMIRVENTSNQSDINNTQKTAPNRALLGSASTAALSFSTLLVKSPTLASSSVLEGVRIDIPFNNQSSDKHRLYQKNQSCQSLVTLLSEKYKQAIASIEQQYQGMSKLSQQQLMQNTIISPQSTRSRTNSPLNMDVKKKKGFFYLQKLQAMREESLKKQTVPLVKQEKINKRLIFPSQLNDNNNQPNHQPIRQQETAPLTQQSQPRQQLLLNHQSIIDQQTQQQVQNSQSEKKQKKVMGVLLDDKDSDGTLDNKGNEQEQYHLQRNKGVTHGVVVQQFNGIEQSISTKDNVILRVQTEPSMYVHNKYKNNNHNNGNTNSAQQSNRKQPSQSSQKDKIVKTNADFSSSTSDQDFQFDSPIPQHSSKFKSISQRSSNNYSTINNSSRSPSRRQSKSINDTNLPLRDFSQEKINFPVQKKQVKQSQFDKDNTVVTKSSNNPLLHVLLTSKTLTSSVSNDPPTTTCNSNNNCRYTNDETSQQKYSKRLMLLKPLQLDGLAVNTIEVSAQSDRYQHAAHNHPLNSDRDQTVKRTYSTHISSATSKISKVPPEFVNSFLARYAQNNQQSPQPANAVTKMSGQICKTIQRQLNWYGQ